MIARLLPEKGVKEYLDASMVIKKEFNDVSFVLIGSIEDSSDITIETLNQYSHSVNYLGYQENIQKHIKDSDVFVLPYIEKVPLKVSLKRWLWVSPWSQLMFQVAKMLLKIILMVY